MFSIFLLVLLGFYVFVADPRSRANQAFAMFISFLALWTVKDLVFWDFQTAGIPAGWWAAASFITALLMQAALVVFAAVFPDEKHVNLKPIAILFAPGLVLVPATLLGLLWKSAGLKEGILEIELSGLAYAFVIYVYVVFAYGAVLLWNKFRKESSTQKRQQLGAILWALFLTALFKTLINIVLPYFGEYSLLPYGSIFVLPGVVIYAYAISNFKLLSIQTALDQFRLFPIAYKVALSIATVAISSFALFQIPIVWWAFSEGPSFEAWRRYITFSLISALVPNLLLVLLIVRSISRPLQRIALAAVKVTEGGYGTEVDMRKSNDEIGILADSFNEMSRKMATDIEQLKSLNERLIRTEKLAAMGTLSAGVAHEVNNPLASISSLIQMLQRGDNLDAGTRDKLDTIATQIERIKRVTNDMMEFGRVRPAEKNRDDINGIIVNAVRLAKFDKSFQSLDLELELSEEMPKALVDPDQIQQVVLNLLLNSRDAMPNGGKLKIATGIVGDSISIVIDDTGTGISHEDLKRVFDPFYSTKSSATGTGLGLAVCYGIVTSHGGTIEASSDHGKGTSFTVLLPIEPSE
ncbi:MAG: HAMP domain-containing protein [Pyrinomonadaceae bacterium]|nr:HAMP domain-containing protein [Pyrinomonadaceae bacterium]